MPTYQRALLIVNPVAGQGWGVRLAERLRRSLARREINASTRITQGPGDARRWAAAAGPHGFDLIFAIGGDGTVGEVVAGQTCSEQKIPVAIMPVGTANVVSLALGLPWFPALAIDKLLQARTMQFDVGYVPQLDRYFFLMAALGYPARIIQDSPRKWKNLFGVFTYFAVAFRNALNLHEAQIRIRDENGFDRFFRGNTILVSNIGEITDINFKISPQTSAHDGKFDVTVISSRTLWYFFKTLFRVLIRRRKASALVQGFQAASVMIESDPPVEVQVDGENLGRTPFTAEIRRRGVELVVGQRYGEVPKSESIWDFKLLKGWPRREKGIKIEASDEMDSGE